MINLIPGSNNKLKWYKGQNTVESYFKIVYAKNKMDRQRHTSDIEHPMYEIIDNALSAEDG